MLNPKVSITFNILAIIMCSTSLFLAANVGDILAASTMSVLLVINILLAVRSLVRLTKESLSERNS